MKKFILFTIIVLSICLISLPVVADDKQIPVEKMRGGGGFQIGSIYLPLEDINTYLQDNNFETFAENTILFGGGGIGGKKDGYRIGGYGMGGSQKVKGDTSDQEAVLSIGYGGCLVEKGIYTGKNMDISFGSMIGGGGLELDITHDKPSSVEEGINCPYGIHLVKIFFALQPRANLHYQFAPSMGIDLSVGYLITYDFGEEWKIGEQTVDGPMENFAGPTIGMKYSFGF